MAGCGYVCPVCEGKGIDEQGLACVHCTPQEAKEVEDKTEDGDEGIR